MSKVQYPPEGSLDSVPTLVDQPNDVVREGDEANREYPGNRLVKLSNLTVVGVGKTDYSEQFSSTNVPIEDPVRCVQRDEARKVRVPIIQIPATKDTQSASEKEKEEECSENRQLSEDYTDASIGEAKKCAEIEVTFGRRPKQDVCQFCNGIGHSHRSCQQLKLKCYICGTWGHPGYLCAMRACLICFTFGHFTSKCPVSRSNIYKRICNRCRCRGHLEKDCPDMWRQFHSSTGSHCELGQNWEKKNQTCLYCFNCGNEGHLGHQCNQAGLYNNRIFHFKPYVTVYSTLEELRVTKTSQELEFYEQLREGRGSSVDKATKMLRSNTLKTIGSFRNRKRPKRAFYIRGRKRLLLQEQPAFRSAKAIVADSQTRDHKDY